jgi:hypothetical protein
MSAVMQKPFLVSSDRYSVMSEPAERVNSVPGRTLVPSVFCWTRFGTEAGESIAEILARKERERRATGGLFFWGIGNSVGPALVTLLRRGFEPEVLFSPISGQPREVDARPTGVIRWLGGLTLDGDPYTLPASALVTSRDKATAHYALACSSLTPLELREQGRIDVATLRNVTSGRPIGASQVTAVVERSGPTGGRIYPVLLRARLSCPYLLRLEERVVSGEVVKGRARRAA